MRVGEHERHSASSNGQVPDEQDVTAVALDTGEILSTHRIEPDKGYWRNTRDPGRWPGSRATD